MATLITTLGPKGEDELGFILPHEHIFVDLRTWDKPGYGEAVAEDVIRLMAPEIEKIKVQGVSALIDCGPVGVGRRADILKTVSEATDFPLVIPTGIYREPWVPDWAHKASQEELCQWMLAELEGEIEESGVQAAWIKLSAGDDGITDCEAKILRAAAEAGAATGAVIGSHTIRGRVVMNQLDILEEAGYTPERFIWIHTQNESDLELHLEVARRGAWLEYDAVGSEKLGDQFFIEHIMMVLEAGFAEQLLLSHDRGWYDPAKPGGGTPKPFTYLIDTFLPKLRDAGVDDKTINVLTHKNPFGAFAR